MCSHASCMAFFVHKKFTLFSRKRWGVPPSSLSETLVKSEKEMIYLKKRKTSKSRHTVLRCPHCGSVMILRPASEIYHDSHCDRMLYVCPKYPQCDTYVGTHPGTNTPLGVPANGDLRNLRIQAHRKFDRIWQSGIMSKDNAYRWFADSFGLRLKDAHIGMCGEYQCKELIRLCEEVLKNNHCVA